MHLTNASLKYKLNSDDHEAIQLSKLQSTRRETRSPLCKTVAKYIYPYQNLNFLIESDICTNFSHLRVACLLRRVTGSLVIQAKALHGVEPRLHSQMLIHRSAVCPTQSLYLSGSGR